MVIDAESALRAVCIVLQNDEGHKTARASLESGFAAAVGTVLGSLAGGSKGIIPGALLGACAAYIFKKDTFKSIIEVIQEDLSAKEKEELASNAQQVISSFGIVDVAILMNMASQNENFQRQLLRCVNSFVDNHVANTSTVRY